MSESNNTIKVKLSKEIDGPDGKISELELREPTGADIERCGNPVSISNMGANDAKINFDAKAMTQMISTLSGHIPVVIGRLSANDWNSAAWAVSGFFVPIFGNVS